MKKSTDKIDNQSFFQKKEVIQLRKSYLAKLEGEISELEAYVRQSLDREGKIAIDDTQYGTVHKIKGVGGTFQFPLVTDVAIEILALFTRDAKIQTCYLDQEQGNLLLDLIQSMNDHIKTYKAEMGIA